MAKKSKAKEVEEFLVESNAIESVYLVEAYDDALKAWNYAITLKEMKPDNILEIHRLLMKNIDPVIAGKYRNHGIWIGMEVKPFISYSLFKEELNTLCNKMRAEIDFGAPFRSLNKAKGNKVRDLPVGGPALVAKECHIEFERIHPFPDGNGRTGRIIYNWHRLKLGLPLHIIHVGDEQYEYYRWFERKD